MADEMANLAATWLAAGRATWPTVAHDDAAFLAAVKSKLPDDAAIEAARSLHAADLWLTIACTAGDPAALAAFDEHYVAPLGKVLRSMRLTPDQIDEVKQELRTKLLVGGEDRPRIAEFSGRADLRTWVRTAAVRVAIDLMRRKSEVPVEDEEELLAVRAIEDDPDVLYMKERYRRELRAAIALALEQLSARERLLLKLHYIDKLTVERLGAMFDVHHATAARWLIAARETLAESANRLLVEQLGVTVSELRSIARLVESQLDLSLQRLLA